jgi:hypothetical protein
MKILFVAVFNKNSTNWAQSKAFEENGHKVIEFNYREISSRIGDIKRDNLLIKTCNEEKPNLVLFSKCNEINYRVIIECNKVSKTALWYMDPLNCNFNSSLINKIKYCHHTFCALWEPFEAAKNISGDKVKFLQEGFDHIQNYPIDIKYKYDVSFIGILRNKRFDYHKALKFDVISNAYGEEHSKAVSESKINLNFTEGGTSDRTYKVLASKGFLLTEPWPNMEKDFTINEDLVIFENAEELKSKIDYYLNNEEERLKIAESGYKTVQKFSRFNWAKEIVNNI